MRAYLTGGTGFVGAWLLTPPRRDGRHGRRPRVPRSTSRISPCSAPTSKRPSPDVVYHLAALTHVGRSWSEPAETFRVNAMGTLNLLEAAARCDGSSRRRPRQLGGGLRPRHRRGAARRARRASAGDALRGEQGGGRVPRAAGILGQGPAGRPGAAVQPRGTRTVRRLRGLGARPADGRSRARARPGRCGWATSPPRATSPTCATSCGPTVCSRRSGAAGEAYNVCSGRAVSIAALAEQMAGLLSCEVDAGGGPRPLPPRRGAGSRRGRLQARGRDRLASGDPPGHDAGRRPRVLAREIASA